MIPLSTSTKLRTYMTTGLIGCSFAALIIYLVIVGGNKDALPFMTFTNTNFNFHVYCPVDQDTTRMSSEVTTSTSTHSTPPAYMWYMSSQPTSPLQSSTPPPILIKTQT